MSIIVVLPLSVLHLMILGPVMSIQYLEWGGGGGGITNVLTLMT